MVPRRLVAAIAAACVVPGCAGGAGPLARYRLGEPAPYGSALEDGRYAVLSLDTIVVDILDADFGLRPLRDGRVLYLTVRSDGDEEFPDWASAGAYVVFDGADRAPLSEILPDFSDHFSSPSVIDGAVYYWRLEPANAPGRYLVHAARWDGAGAAVRSCALVRTTLETDNRWHLLPPAELDGAILFRTYGFERTVDPRLRPDADGFCAAS